MQDSMVQKTSLCVVSPPASQCQPTGCWLPDETGQGKASHCLAPL